jgi:hypothetical protein
MLQLKQAQQVAEVIEINGQQVIDTDLWDIWDEIVNEPVPASDDAAQRPGPASALAPSDIHRSPIGPNPIEDQVLTLPSNGNTSAVYRELECSHRIAVAEHHLNQIRNLIAEKSFQFSHVIRISPRKGVTTRSRAAVKKLNMQIALHCRVYSRCRARVLALGAEPATQARLRLLRPDDVKASTAIINPNEPGSTQLKLSWIWQTAGGHRLGLAANLTAGAGAGADDSVLECKSLSYNT